MEENIPTRQDIQNKIGKIRASKGFSTMQSEIYQKVKNWLDGLDLPAKIIVVGKEVDPKLMILEDLPSYPNY
jgi:hypothetical protein